MKDYWFSMRSTNCKATTMLLSGVAFGQGQILLGCAVLVLGAVVEGIWGRT